jgi:iron-sulfur cluster assembly protein CyaY
MGDPMTEREFEKLAEDELTRMIEALDEAGDDIDPEFQMGVLRINFDDGTKYVVNSHRAARQIWMAAERTAWHFDYQADSKRWVAPNGDELWSAVQGTLSRKLGRELDLRGEG